MRILVIGKNGQLAQELKSIQSEHAQLELDFKGRPELDIANFDQVRKVIESGGYQYCINASAYTAVDLAETEQDQAFLINGKAVGNLAESCADNQVTLIHVSTDFVFDGSKNTPYNEEDTTAAIGVYGASKLQGEELIQQRGSHYFIIRTSWLYSEYGNNFVKTMIRLGSERDELGVIVDQIGSPTHAKDLAHAILHIISTQNTQYGVYHYSNEGVASWYDFAKAIFEIFNINVDLKAIGTKDYPTPAKRPHYSVMDKSKIKGIGVNVPYWRDSLNTITIDEF